MPKKIFVLLILLSGALPFIHGEDLVYAEKKFIEAVGYAVMGDGPEENPAVAKERARTEAKRAASEQAGVYVESLTVMQSGRITQDEIRTISANVIEIVSADISTEILGGLAVKYNCQMKVVVDTERLESYLHTDEREKFNEAVQRNKELEGRLKQVSDDLSALKEKFKSASESEKVALNAQVKQNERQFSAAARNDEGLRLYNRKDYAGAIKCFKEAAELDPTYAAPWNGLGWTYRDTKDWDKAIESFLKAVELEPDYASPFNGLAYVYNYRGNYEKAVSYCERAIALDSTYAAPWNNLGYAYGKLKNYTKAIECYKHAAELDRYDAAPLLNLGSTYEIIGDNEHASEFYLHALEVNPNYAKAWSNLGYLYNRTGKYDKAVDCCQKATELDPASPQAWNGLGYAYNHKKTYYKAVTCFKKALELNPKYANAWNGLGYAYSRLDNYINALEAYTKAFELEPNIETYKKNLEAIKERLGEKK